MNGWEHVGTPGARTPNGPFLAAARAITCDGPQNYIEPISACPLKTTHISWFQFYGPLNKVLPIILLVCIAYYAGTPCFLQAKEPNSQTNKSKQPLAKSKQNQLDPEASSNHMILVEPQANGASPEQSMSNIQESRIKAKPMEAKDICCKPNRTNEMK